jgi:CRISPR-associated protein Cmr3
MKSLLLEGLSPLLFGTGRPFGTEPGALLAETFALPLPSTLAGAIRSELARQAGWMRYTDDTRDSLLAVEVKGPILFINGKPAFQAPADAVSSKKADNQATVPALPRKEPDGVFLPDGLSPTGFVDDVELEPDKSQRGRYWSGDRLLKWLSNTSKESVPYNDDSLSVVTESRIHVGIDRESRRHQKGILFETQGVCLGRGLITETRESLGENGAAEWDWRIWAAYQATESVPATDFRVLTLGGERRLAAAKAESSGWMSAYRQAAEETLTQSGGKVRMYLVTPALFNDGWKPDLDELYRLSGVKLKLVSACVGRRQAMTGWQVEAGAPRLLRYLAPAGSTYFFDVEAGDPRDLAKLTLEPISDVLQDRKDGFGLALWGTWKYLEEAA